MPDESLLNQRPPPRRPPSLTCSARRRRDAPSAGRRPHSTPRRACAGRPRPQQRGRGGAEADLEGNEPACPRAPCECVDLQAGSSRLLTERLLRPSAATPVRTEAEARPAQPQRGAARCWRHVDLRPAGSGPVSRGVASYRAGLAGGVVRAGLRGLAGPFPAAAAATCDLRRLGACTESPRPRGGASLLRKEGLPL